MPPSILTGNHAGDATHARDMSTAEAVGHQSRFGDESTHYKRNEATKATKAVRRAPDPTQLDKHSWEYIVKSGIAGGFAGCAVSHLA